MRLFNSVERQVSEIRNEWGAMVYRTTEDARRERKRTGPDVRDLLPQEMTTRAICGWLAQMDGVSVRVVYREWDWLEVWELAAVHLALLKSSR